MKDKVQLDPCEGATYSNSSSRQVFRIGPLSFGVVICHEGWHIRKRCAGRPDAAHKVVFDPHFHIAEPGG